MQDELNLPKRDLRKKTPFFQLLTYGFGGIIPIALFNIAGQLMGLIGNISLGLSALWLGVILIIPRLWDAVSDPIVGHFSDNLRTKYGRRRPLILVGGISVAISFVLMWWIPDGEWIHQLFNTESSYKWFQLGYILFWLLIFFTACTIFEIPHGALGMEMSNDPHERTRLFSAKSFLGNLFAMSTPWLFALANMEYFKGAEGNEADGMKYVSIAVAILLIPLSIWWFISIKEPALVTITKQKKTKFWDDIKKTLKNKTFLRLIAIVFVLAMGFNFVNLLGYYIPIYYIFEGDKEVASTLLGINGTIWAVTGLLAVFPLNWISPKYGKRKTLLIAIILMSLAQLSKTFCYNVEYPYLIIIPTILLSSGMLFFFTLGSSMVGDICDEDELKTGRKSQGSFYSIFWWFIKMGTAFASLVAGLLIVFTQFDETQVIKVDDFRGTINSLLTNVEDFSNAKNFNASEYKIYAENLREKTNQKIEQNLLYLKKSNKDLEKVENSNINAVVETNIIRTEVFKRDIKKIMLLNISETELKESTKKLTNIYVQSCLEIIDVKAKMLQLYFKEQQEDKKTENHYSALLNDLKQLKEKISALEKQDVLIPNLKIVLDKSLKLTKQSDYTLFTMRVVEIGLPLLLCIISYLLALKYPLTEERIQEIKVALDQKNQS